MIPMKSLHKLHLWIFFENTSLYWQFLEHSRNVFYCFVRFSSIQLIFLGSTLVWQKLYHITIQYICWITQPIINPIRGLLLSIHNSYIVTNIASHTNSIHFIFFFIGKQSKKNKTLMVYFGMASHSSSKIWMNEVWNYHLAVAKSFRPGLKRRGLLNLHLIIFIESLNH